MSSIAAVATFPVQKSQDRRAPSTDNARRRSSATGRAAASPTGAALDDRALQAIMDRAGRGDKEALGTLYDMYSPRIYRYLYRRTGNAAVAEDLTSNVFVRVIEAISAQHCWHDSFTGWLYRIAQNQFIDHVRQVGRRPQAELPETMPCPLAAEMEEDVLRHCSGDDVRAALNDLRPEYATVLTLRFTEGLSHAEVGRMLGKNADAVKVTQHRALKSLRQKLVQRQALQEAA
jgi:RNA polymerase sigma-70 factor (ECF subfamily)